MRERERNGFPRYCFRRAENTAQIFLCSLQFLRNTIMATKFGSLNTSGGTNGEFPDSNILWLQTNKSGINWLLTLCYL